MKLWYKLNQWIEKADHHDQKLGRNRRIWKWSLILGSILILFGLTFLQRWQISLSHYSIPENKLNQHYAIDSFPLQPTPFELPTDSFEQLLKQQINEDHTH